MTGTRVEIHGEDTLTRTLATAGDRIGDLEPPNRDAAGEIAGRASQLAPRLTGILAASIHGEATPSEAVIFATAPYAGPVHSGVPSRNIEARPFLTDAASDIEPAWIKGYERHIETALDHVKGV